MLAFSSPKFLKGASKFEDRLYRKKIATQSIESPVFITSLARGGTTAVLNAIHDIRGVVTHEYKDMPFITEKNPMALYCHRLSSQN